MFFLLDFMGKKALTRPNDFCLACDTKLTKKPNTLRKFLYCSDSCRVNVQQGINPLGLTVKKKKKTRNSKSGMELAMVWFAIRNLEEPLTGHQIMIRTKEIFKENKKLVTENFTFLFHYFQGVKKIDGKTKTYFPIDKTLSFREVLKPRYAEYLFNNNI